MNNRYYISIAILLAVALIGFIYIYRTKQKAEIPEIPQTPIEIQIKKQYEDTYYNDFRSNDTSDELLHRTINRHKAIDEAVQRQRDKKPN